MTDFLDSLNAKPRATPRDVAVEAVQRSEGGLAHRAIRARKEQEAADKLRDETSGMELVGAATVSGGIGTIDRFSQERRVDSENPEGYQLPETFRDEMGELGIRPAQWGIFDRARNDEHYQLLKSFAYQNEQAEMTRSQFGLIPNLAVEMLDPVAFAMDAATGGLAWSTRVGRLANLARAGSVAAGVNFALEAGASRFNEEITLADMATSAGLGLVLGGALGARRGTDLINEAKIERILKDDIALERESIGAARDNRIPENKTPGLAQRDLSDLMQEHADVAIDEIDTRPAYAKVRVSNSARMGNMVAPLVRSTSRWLFRDGVGHADKNQAVKYSAGERASLYRSLFETKLQRGWYATLDEARKELGFSYWDRASELVLEKEIANGLRGITPESAAARKAVGRYREVLDDVYDLGVRAGVLDKGSKGENYFPQIQSRAAYKHIFGEMGLSEDQAIDVFEQSILARMKADSGDNGAQYARMQEAAQNYEGTSPAALSSKARADDLQAELGERQASLRELEEALDSVDPNDARRTRAAKRKVNEATRKLSRTERRFRKAQEDFKKATDVEDASDYRVKEAKRVMDDGGIDKDLARAYATALVRRGKAQLDGGESPMVRGIGTDDIDELRAVLAEAGISGPKADSILLPYMSRATEGAKLGSAKKRIRLDNTFRTKVTNRYGQEVEIGVTDFMDSDVNRVVTSYTREIGGWSAMAEMGNIRNPTEMKALRNELLRSADEAGDNKETVAKLFDVGVNSVLGRSTEANPNSAFSRGLRFLRDTQFARVMNQVGFTVFSEIGPVIAYSGLKNVWDSLSFFKDYARRGADGTLSSTEARFMEDLAGTGTEFLRNPVHLRADGDAFAAPLGGDNSLGRGVDNATQYANRFASIMSGMAPLNTMLQRIAGRATMMRLLEMANSPKKLSGPMQQRMRNWGLDAADQEALFASMRGKKSIDELAEAGMSLEQRSRLQNFMFRVTRHQVLEGDASDAMLLMSTSGGKVVTQFRSFMVYSYERHFLNSIYNIKDWNTWAMVTVSSVMAGLQFTGRTYLNTIGDEEKRKRLLTKENLIKNAVGMSSWGAVVPALVDTAMHVTGNDPFFEGNRSSGMSNSLITGSPVMDFVSKAGDAAKLPAKALRSDQEITKKDMQDFSKLFWFQNLTGWQNMQNQMLVQADKQLGLFPEKSELQKEENAKKREKKKRRDAEKPFLGIFH